MRKKYISNSRDDTEKIGETLATMLQSGDCVCLYGDMGAGKTALTGGICKALGTDGYVTSPTYTIVNEYLTSHVHIYHFDLYRLSDEDEVYDIGFNDYIDNGAICIIEWPERAGSLLPEKCINVVIHKDDDDLYRRTIEIFLPDRSEDN